MPVKRRHEVLDKDLGVAKVAEEQSSTLKPSKDVVTANTGIARRVVTPASSHSGSSEEEEQHKVGKVSRRALFQTTANDVASVTQLSATKERLQEEQPKAKRRLIFGRLVDEIVVQPNVRRVYGIIKKLTGSIGGNASNGPIYGELTIGSMQKMVNLMKEHTGLDEESRFIDVGSGIGKPNLHVAQDPGVAFSYGIEIEATRSLLGMSSLKGVLDAAAEQREKGSEGKDENHSMIQHRCIFEQGDIRDAKSFDPFTHVYMFSIGFPPALWVDLAERWNRSSSPYLICFHGPKDIIRSYAFNVELLAQAGTSMHGSKEGHMAYIYRRDPLSAASHISNDLQQPCDPLFVEPWKKVRAGLDTLAKDIDAKVEEKMASGPSTRASRKVKRR